MPVVSLTTLASKRSYFHKREKEGKRRKYILENIFEKQFNLFCMTYYAFYKYSSYDS